MSSMPLISLRIAKRQVELRQVSNELSRMPQVMSLKV